MVTVNLKVPFVIHKKKKWFVASCPVLDVHSQGETEEQAKKNLGEALYLFFVSCFERGTLDEVLKKCGFKVQHEIRKKTLSLMRKESFINVPIPFYIPGHLHECHALHPSIGKYLNVFFKRTVLLGIFPGALLAFWGRLNSVNIAV